MPSIPLFHESAPAYAELYTELNSLTSPTLILLRAHLLIEVLLREFLASEAENPAALDDAKLSFGQAVSIARSHFDEDNNPRLLWDYLYRINRLRNTMAHNLDTRRFDSEWQSLVLDHKKEFPSEAVGTNIETLKHLLISIASNLAYHTRRNDIADLETQQ